MNLTYQIINDLSEIDFDDLYERSRDAIDVSWPAESPLMDSERKEIIRTMITSGLNNEWPGLNKHSPNDIYVVVKTIDSDTGNLMSLVCGFVLEGGIFDGRHSLSAADENGSRNYLYSDSLRQLRSELNQELQVDKYLYRNIPADSVMHRSVRMREVAGHYTILEDVESMPGFRNITVQFN